MSLSKLISTTAGVGSLVTTKWGGFVMPLSINSWTFINKVAEELKGAQESLVTLDSEKIKTIEDKCGVEIINDQRFVNFLEEQRDFKNLKCFVAIPHVQLNEWNKLDIENNPLNTRYKKLYNKDLAIEDLTVPAINFPKWFLSKRAELRTQEEWAKAFKQKDKFLIPPRDPNNKRKNRKGEDVYGLLSPVPLVLICPNGHISDIPWYQLFCAGIKHEKVDRQEGFDLFHYHCDDCKNGGKHDLKWIVSRNNGESWGRLQCAKCGESYQLAGVMNIKPYCQGERPWEKDAQNDACRTMVNGQSQKNLMQVAIVTSNSLYYANVISSLYIPSECLKLSAGQMTPKAQKAYNKLCQIFNKYLAKHPDTTKNSYWQSKDFDTYEEFAESAEIDWDIAGLSEEEYTSIADRFLERVQQAEANDPYTEYRKAEYDVFTDETRPRCAVDGLEFEPVAIPERFQEYLSHIKQVKVLSLTSTQLGFGRVRKPSFKVIDGKVYPPGDEMKPIYSGEAKDVFVLPAYQTSGEGLFFSFNQDKINEWVEEFDMNTHYDKKLAEDDMDKFLYDKMDMYGKAKFYLLHTFSHIIMKELEFSCGYPTASLSERLYFSDEMCGVLIYTADGSEGSMGGLVMQGETDSIDELITKALKRARHCSSDPLCWENDEGLNRAACFSCAMVSETSCEHGNTALDRRALVDENFGFFRKLV